MRDWQQRSPLMSKWNTDYREVIMEKLVILLNGPSSSGKSSLAQLLQGLILARRRERYEIISIDDFLTMNAQDSIYEEDVYGILKYYNQKVRVTVNLRKKLEEHFKEYPLEVNGKFFINLYPCIREFLGVE